MHSTKPLESTLPKNSGLLSPIRRAVEWFALGGVSVAVVLHATIRDSIWPISILYYGLSPGIALMATFLGLAMARRSGKAFWTTVLLAVLSWWYVSDVHTGCLLKPRPPRDFRFVCWNVFRGRLNYERVITSVRGFDADIVVMVEAGPNTATYRYFWPTKMTDFVVTPMSDDYTLLTHCKATRNRLPKHISRRIQHATVHHKSGDIEIIMVHPMSQAWIDRGPMLRSVDEIVANLRAEDRKRIIVCGDFNTPTGSVHLDSIRKSFSLAQEQPAGPFRPTWPAFVPVLKLDQIWYSDELVLAGDGCRHLWTTSSDHRPVLAEFAVSDQAK